MATESTEKKAERILVEGRLVIERVLPTGLIVASCRGFSEGEVYRLGYRPDEQRWGCTCEASSTFGRTCSHLMALQRVTVKPRV